MLIVQTKQALSQFWMPGRRRRCERCRSFLALQPHGRHADDATCAWPRRVICTGCSDAHSPLQGRYRELLRPPMARSRSVPQWSLLRLMLMSSGLERLIVDIPHGQGGRNDQSSAVKYEALTHTRAPQLKDCGAYNLSFKKLSEYWI